VVGIETDGGVVNVEIWCHHGKAMDFQNFLLTETSSVDLSLGMCFR